MALVYPRGWQQIATGAIKWDASLKAILMKNTYVPNPDHDYIGDISAHEANGRGCLAGFGASGRKPMTGATVALDDVNNKVVLVGPTLLRWVGVDVGTVCGVVIAREWSTDADSPLVAFLDGQGFPMATAGGTISVAFADGAFISVT